VVKNEEVMSGEKKIDTLVDQDENTDNSVDTKANVYSNSEVKQYRNNSNMMRIEERGSSLIDP
jgi:hypothetical protein